MKFAIGFDEAYHDSMSEESGVVCSLEEDKAVQSGKDDADINILVRRFGVTGQIPVASMQPFYGDFTDAEDYQTALHRVMEAEAAFAALPSDIRNKFENDPAKLMQFLDDDNNYDEARRLGLLEPEPEAPAPQKVVVENWPAPPA